jgi:hypothetical protein
LQVGQNPNWDRQNVGIRRANPLQIAELLESCSVANYPLELGG